MAKTPTPDAVSIILSNPSLDSLPEVPEIIVQIVDLKSTGNRFMFQASDGKLKLRAILPPSIASEVSLGNIQNLGLICILDYTLNDIPMKNEKYLIVNKCEAVSSALEAEFKIEEPTIVLKPEGGDEIMGEVKTEEAGVLLKPKQGTDSMKGSAGIIMKPKQELNSKSAAQIVHEQHGNMAPASRMAMTRRVHPLNSLNPYQGNWTIKVRVTSKGNLRSFKNAKGEGQVFSVELTDEEGTQIQATMFGEAAKKFHEKFEMGKVYYISKGSLRVANKQFSTVKNDYEMSLNENSVVEEAVNEPAFIPETKFDFVPIDLLGPYVNGKELVDVIGVVQNVSPTMSIRRKSDGEMIPKRDITIADDTKKTVVISLWNDLATNLGQELLEIADQHPIVAIKALRVGDYQGISLSTVGKSTVLVNPDLPEAVKLTTWYDSEGKASSLDSVASGMSTSPLSGAKSMYSERVSLSYISSNPTLGDPKPVFFSIKAYLSYIKPEQTMWYRACKTCNKKVTDGIGSGYWCEGCQKNDAESSLRYIMGVKVSDASGEVWLSMFNEQAEKILGCTADELDSLKSQEEDEGLYKLKLREAMWLPHLFRIAVSQNEFKNEKRQRITVKAMAPVDFAAESRFLLEAISKSKAS